MKAAPLVALLLVVACADAPPPKPPEPIYAQDPEQCPLACANLARHLCPEAKTTLGGTTCESLCRKLAIVGSVRPHCVALAHDIPDLHDCNVQCRGGI